MKEDLNAYVLRLSNELKQTKDMDLSTRDALRVLQREILVALEKGSDLEADGSREPSLSAQLQGIMEEFKMHHPKVTDAALSVIAERLADMGI